MSSHKAVQSLPTFLANIVAQCLFPSSVQTFPNAVRSGSVMIDKLPDDALLEIFVFYLADPRSDGSTDFDKWHTLVHVCRRWRNVVFASPRHLNLQLLCNQYMSVRAMLDIWPALPIVIEGGAQRTVWPVSRERVRKSASEREIDWAGKSDGESEEKESESESDWERWDWDNIIAALEHPGRVHRIKLTNIPDTAWDTLAAAMQVSFPELTDLQFWSSNKGPVAVLPDSLLGGSAPRLRLLDLKNVAYPAVWRRLDLSVNDLVYLSLWGLPHTGYIPPESMVACLSSLNRLKSLRLGFQSPRSRPDQPQPPPQARILLPALATFTFEGMSEYLEDFVARIDTPMLTRLNISFFLDLVFDIPHFKQFIGRLKRLQLSKTARMTLHPTFILLNLDFSLLKLLIKCDRIDWQISSMALVCGQLSPFFSLIERLDFATERYLQLRQLEGDDGIDHTQVVELFQSFPLSRGSIYPRYLCLSLYLRCRNILEKLPLKCYPTCMGFSWGVLPYQ